MTTFKPDPPTRRPDDRTVGYRFRVASHDWHASEHIMCLGCGALLYGGEGAALHEARFGPNHWKPVAL